jgi:1-hydroxycarotenoid 3,4-desaturase
LQFSDPRLQQLFGRYATYVGGSPYLSPAILGLIWHSEARGVWAVEGGMHRLPPQCIDWRRRAARGSVSVPRCNRSRRRAAEPTGVRLADGTRLKADIVLFNGDPKALFDGHLGEATADAVPKQAVAPRSLSAFVWGFRRRAIRRGACPSQRLLLRRSEGGIRRHRQGPDAPRRDALHLRAGPGGSGPTRWVPSASRSS